jgi:hypothetical protein
VHDWLEVLSRYPTGTPTDQREAARTGALAVLRGALLDLLATGDRERTTAAVHHYLGALGSPSRR